MRYTTKALLTLAAILLLGVPTSLAQNAATAPGTAATPQPPKPAVTPVPAGLGNARATMARFLEDTNAGNFTRAAECLDLSLLPSDTTATGRQNLAWKLKESLDRIQLINLGAISDNPAGPTYVFQPEPQLPAIEIARDQRGVWRFSPETVAAIDGLYEKVEDRRPVAGRNWLRDLFPVWAWQTAFLLPHYQWICLLLVIFLGIAADAFTRFMLNRAMLTWFKLKRVDVDRRIEQNVWKPVGLLVRALVWYGGMVLIGIRPEVLSVLQIAVEFFAVAAAVWTAFRLIDLLSNYMLRKAAGTDTKFDDLFIPLVSRSLKVFAACVGLITFAQAFNLPVAGLLSGLGLGGLALGLASKDAVGNLFGSVTVLVDRPFEIGDWIKTQGIEGSVETVGMRSTRVRTFYNSLITIPNGLLTTAVVDNMGRRQYRRIKTYLGLQYDTPPERIDAFCEGVRELIRRHPYTRKDYYHVYFNQYSGSSLDVLLYCFLECPDWSVELRERHRLFIDILKLAEQLGVSFAFPTQTLHLYREEHDSAGPASLDDPLHAGRQLASSIAGPPLTGDQRPGLVEFSGPSSDNGPLSRTGRIVGDTSEEDASS